MTRNRMAPVCLAAVLLAAMPLDTQGQPKEAARVGILWWPAPADGPGTTTADNMERCLASRIGEAAPELVLVGARMVRDAVYPLLEATTQPRTEPEFAELLAREDVHARLAQRGLRYLIALSGGTELAQPGGLVLCGAGYGGGGCLGFAWQDETTTVDAALWLLEDGASVRRHEGVKAEGANALPAFIFPLPLPARTMERACRDLAPRIASSIRDAETARPASR